MATRATKSGFAAEAQAKVGNRFYINVIINKRNYKACMCINI